MPAGQVRVQKRHPGVQRRQSGPVAAARQNGQGSLGDWSDSPEEVAHGQVIVIAARWILVAAGLLLALWQPEALTRPEAMGELRIQIVLILGLAVANFFLHSQVLMRRPVVVPVAYAASAADLIVVTLVVLVGGGFASDAYIFYFPAVLALSVAFQTRVTVGLVGGAIAAYGLIAAATACVGDESTVVLRLLMVAGVAACGGVYRRVERDRRAAAAQNSQVRHEPLTR